MKKPCSEMFCLRNQDITDAKAFFYLFFMSNSGYFILFPILLFSNLASVNLDLNAIADMLLALCIITFSVSTLLWLLKRIYAIPPARFGVYLQSHIRFNK